MKYKIDDDILYSVDDGGDTEYFYYREMFYKLNGMGIVKDYNDYDNNIFYMCKYELRKLGLYHKIRENDIIENNGFTYQVIDYFEGDSHYCIDDRIYLYRA